MQLIYRGQAFNYSPSTLSSTSVKTGLSRNLFYRGMTYNYQLVTKSTRLPKAINWRFAGTAEMQQQSLNPAH